MIDMGDLREGIWFSEYQKILDTINLIKTLPCLDLYGLGTNFNCYGTVLPTVKNGEDFGSGFSTGTRQRIDDSSLICR